MPEIELCPDLEIGQYYRLQVRDLGRGAAQRGRVGTDKQHGNAQPKTRPNSVHLKR